MDKFRVEAEQASEEREKATLHAAEGFNPWPGMTYIEGVRDALAWALGDEEASPPSELED